MGNVEFTEDLNILEKNMSPVMPPGILLIKNISIAINCTTAHKTVNEVDCKCRAKYKVPVKVTM